MPTARYEVRNRLTNEVQFTAEIECASDTLRSIKLGLADFWMTLTQNAGEVPALIAALRAGKVNGSQYEGECACLIGTIAERWFFPIKPGDTPDKEGEGAFRARHAIAWAEEWCALNGVSLEAAEVA